LNALHKLAIAQKSVFDAIVGEDKGGRSNLFTDLYISADYQLVERGWLLFDMFKSDQAKGTMNKPFEAFLQSVYEYATDKGANEQGAPALLDKIKRMIGPLRKTKEILKEVHGLEKQLNALRDQWIKEGVSPVPSAITQKVDLLESQSSAAQRQLRQSVSKKRNR